MAGHKLQVEHNILGHNKVEEPGEKVSIGGFDALSLATISQINIDFAIRVHKKLGTYHTVFKQEN